ncbi:hypothetical protein MASR1M12_11610 [Erysipelotrichia bacterium]
MKIRGNNIPRCIVQNRKQICFPLAAFMQHSRAMHKITDPQFPKVPEFEGSDILTAFIAIS